MTETQTNNIRKKYLREEYVSRINRVIDYIESHIDVEVKDMPDFHVAYVRHIGPYK